MDLAPVLALSTGSVLLDDMKMGVTAAERSSVTAEDETFAIGPPTPSCPIPLSRVGPYSRLQSIAGIIPASIIVATVRFSNFITIVFDKRSGVGRYCDSSGKTLPEPEPPPISVGTQIFSSRKPSLVSFDDEEEPSNHLMEAHVANNHVSERNYIEHGNYLVQDELWL